MEYILKFNFHDWYNSVVVSPVWDRPGGSDNEAAI